MARLNIKVRDGWNEKIFVITSTDYSEEVEFNLKYKKDLSDNTTHYAVLEKLTYETRANMISRKIYSNDIFYFTDSEIFERDFNFVGLEELKHKLICFSTMAIFLKTGGLIMKEFNDINFEGVEVEQKELKKIR